MAPARRGMIPSIMNASTGERAVSEDESEAQQPRRGHAIAATALIVIASVLLPLAGITVWVRNLVLDSDRYVDTMAPLVRDPAIQEKVATTVSEAVVESLDVEQRAQDALPDRASFLAAPIAAGAEQLVHKVTLDVLESDAFASVWDFANKEAHDQVVAALTGRDGKTFTTNDGKVVLNLGPLAAQVAQELAKVGFKVPDNVDVERLNVRFVLIDSQDLASVQRYARWLDQLAWVLPVLSLLLYALGVWLAPRRRAALLKAGVGVTIAMAVSLLAYGFARTVYLDNLPPSTDGHAAGAAVFDTVTRFIQRGLRALLALGLLIWASAWLAGSSRAARAVRAHWNRLLGRAGEGLGDAVEIGPASRWVAANARGLRIGLAAFLLVMLLAWDRPTGLVILGFGVVALVALGAIQMIAAGASRDDAPSDA
jgi:hypothetical protein